MSNELIKRILSSLILIPIFFFFIIKGSFLFISFIILCFFISIYEWNILSKEKNTTKLELFSYLFLFCIYNLRINSEDNYLFFLFIIVICISTDIGGYVFGKLFKGPKLTKLSPNKTFAGALGSFILSIFSMFIFNSIFNEPILTKKLILLTIVISFISQLGDIIISYFKRKSNLKDTGNIIPGHGGLLDRIDGMIFALPTSYIIISINLF